MQTNPPGRHTPPARARKVTLALTLIAFLLSSPVAAGAHVSQDQLTTKGKNDTRIFLPLVSNTPVTLSVDPKTKQASLSFYRNVYLASEGIPINWTGNQPACNEGTTAPEFKQAIQLRLNYFRAMAGVPAGITLSEEYNRKAQKAALMMSVNNALSHSPPASWQCYSADGAQAAGSSDLFLGVYSVDAIDGYMFDPGDGNYAVGHRRWILFPQTRSMGSGDIPPVNGYPAANALWVFDNFGNRPATREEYVAWPPPGYIPYQVVFPRWSFSYPDADFTSATIAMFAAGNRISLSQDQVVNGYGENTLVWEPQITFGTPPISDVAYTVMINNVLVNTSARNFSYEVILFNPDIQQASRILNAGVQIGLPVLFP